MVFIKSREILWNLMGPWDPIGMLYVLSQIF